MVRAQQKSVLRSGMAAWRVGDAGGSKLQLVNSETLAPHQGGSYPILGSILEHPGRIVFGQFLIRLLSCAIYRPRLDRNL
jgi:hypothetical protein